MVPLYTKQLAGRGRVVPAYRDRGAEIVALDRSDVVILRVDADGRAALECRPAA